MLQNNDSIASWICERITAEPLLVLFFIISLTRACIGKFRSPTKSQMIFLLDEYQANNIPEVN